ncbi:Spc7-domain-containing protein [Xylariaceae sp. FL0662B]|nr:Spc7-domain-containing protein [Xylariaceae sp. FL0662B]
MSNRADTTVPSTRRPRKSTGHSPVRKRMEKENITVDVASSLAGNGGRKKSRSKSMGPGGLDALKPGSGNRRMTLAAPAKALPRSILKPSIPQLPEIPPHKPKGHARNSPPSLAVQGTDKLPNPFQNDDSASSGTKIALRTEEEQQAAAREREERERAQLEKEINDRREARRKSLANRRVSFAAEATLHTFHEVEYMQDSTTSTDSSRRASSLAAQSPAAPEYPEASDPPSTPPEQIEDVVPDSPEDQRDLHQKKRRRSSGAPPLNFNNPDDVTLASSIYSSDSEATDGVMEAHEEIGSDSGSDSDADGVSMDLDVDEVTGTSIASAASARSAFTADSNDTLDEALRLATRRAETQKIDEEEEVIPSFGWAKKPALKQASPTRDQENRQNATRTKTTESDDDQEETGAMDMDMDMDITNAVGGIIKSTSRPHGDAQDDEISMDVTRALGGILPQRIKSRNDQPASPAKSVEGSSADDATMDLTMAVGGIRKDTQPEGNLIDFDDDEDMSMEFTTVVGGVLASNKGNAAKRRASLGRRRTIMNGDDEATMDMTTGLGRILPADGENENNGDATMGMDMTTAVGGIINGPSPANDRTKAKHLLEQEVDEADTTPVLNSSSKRRLSAAITGTATSETGSPGLSAFRGKEIRRSTGWRKSATPQGSSPVRTPVSNTGSPAKARTPTVQGPSTPVRRSPSKKRPQTGSPSPKRANFSGSTPKSASKGNQRTSVFQQDPSTGVTTPQILLTPQERRLSGVGADRPGLGSPKVAAIFDRRGSIGETANDFVPREVSRNVTFADAQVIEDEEDREHGQEEDKENRRKILERDADGGDEDNTTTTLKDMISSMTPKKNPLKGRKSLHVGSAKGLLGKRPAELDDDEEAEERDGVKRLKGHQSSPVKNVRLHAPPSKEETTGRVTRSSSRGLEELNGNTTALTLTHSSNKASNASSSPHTTVHFRDAESDQSTYKLDFDEPHAVADPNAQVEDNEERIHLQDFLNMTSIRFMELTTTKRRHTQAPTSLKGGTAPEQEDLSLERCVVAGVCTVPMLELYQHSCRELKKYISEGRRIVREIEKETLEENPPLFREYMSATPEFKLLMDNQFKNVKTHARLLSKAMWYEWRMKLQDGLKEGLIKIAEGMTADEQLLRKEQDLLDSILPKLVKKFESLDKEHENMRSVAQELADCDPEDLQSARSELVELDSDAQARTRKIEELRRQLSETESDISELSQRKKSCIADIEEAEKVREECRGWTSNEISSLKAKCDELEKQHGWAITGISGTTISMTCQREIELVFNIASFQGRKSSNSRIDLWYIAANRERDPQPATPEKEFFVQCIRDHVRGLAPAQTKIKDLLNVVGAAWKKANHTAENVRLLNCTFPTNITKTSDSSIAVRSTLLLVPLQTKVEITLGLHGQSTRDGVEVTIVPQARVVYGEHFKADKVAEYLATRIGSRIVTKEDQNDVESWSDVVVELHERLLARGKKEGA